MNAFAIAAICATVGGTLTAGFVAIRMWIVVCLLQGFGLGMIICLVPLYITEVALPRRRGLPSGCTVFSFDNGYLVCVTHCPIILRSRLRIMLTCFL
jgi:MFS family permease